MINEISSGTINPGFRKRCCWHFVGLIWH